MNTCTHTHVYTHMHTYTQMHVHTNTHVHTHAYTHTHERIKREVILKIICEAVRNLGLGL